MRSLLWIGLALHGSAYADDDDGNRDDDNDDWKVDEGDCDDSDPNVHPEATESCNGIDDDCDEAIDEGCATGDTGGGAGTSGTTTDNTDTGSTNTDSTNTDTANTDGSETDSSSSGPPTGGSGLPETDNGTDSTSDDTIALDPRASLPQSDEPLIANSIGCGCGTATPGAGAWGLIALLFVRRR